jgi:serine/threonine-protein kinase
MPSTHSPDLLANRYRVGARLGRGGMGEVRDGTDLRLDRRVAIKLLRSDLADDDSLRRRFEREARAAARISHANVVAVFDTGEHAGVPFIVMERLPGTTLADELAAGRPGLDRGCALVGEVLSALDAAHHLGVLHRDIKPGNILLDRDGHAKVADFGIAQIADDSDPRTTGILLGTAAYLAPERLAGAPATTASDLYSVGVVLFEVIAGRPPFRAETPLALVMSVTDDEIPRLAALRPGVDPALVAVVERSMAKDPERRYRTAAAMRAALHDAAVASPGGADAADAAETVPVAEARAARTASADRRARTDVLPSRPRDEPAHPSTPRSRRPRSHRAWWMVAALAAVVLVVVLVVVWLAPGDQGAAPPATTPSSTKVTTAPTLVPAPLQRAIDRLDRAVSG